MDYHDRPTWPDYFMTLAHATAARMSCDRARVGAVLVDSHSQIISTGYGGAPRGVATCLEAGHLLEHDHCVRTVHAEHNCILQAARRGVATDGSTIYTTHYPCFDCCKVLIQAGVHDIVYEIPYRRDDMRNQRALQWLQEVGIRIISIDVAVERAREGAPFWPSSVE